MTEKELNQKGDELARILGMNEDKDCSPNSQGRILWETSEGTKTGLGLLRTLKRKLQDVNHLL